MADEFSVYMIYTQNYVFPLARYVDVQQASHIAASAAHHDPAAHRIIITDAGDCICMEWKRGRGVIYPPGVTNAPQDIKILGGGGPGPARSRSM